MAACRQQWGHSACSQGRESQGTRRTPMHEGTLALTQVLRPTEEAIGEERTEVVYGLLPLSGSPMVCITEPPRRGCGRRFRDRKKVAASDVAESPSQTLSGCLRGQGASIWACKALTRPNAGQEGDEQRRGTRLLQVIHSNGGWAGGTAPLSCQTMHAML